MTEIDAPAEDPAVPETPRSDTEQQQANLLRWLGAERDHWFTRAADLQSDKNILIGQLRTARDHVLELKEADAFQDIATLARFLNARNGTEWHEMSMQMLKITEEAGEVAQAWIGYTGQNPRKGVTHSLDDVLAELADVAITAMVGIARLGGDPAVVVGAKTAVMRDRYAVLPTGTETI